MSSYGFSLKTSALHEENIECYHQLQWDKTKNCFYLDSGNLMLQVKKKNIQLIIRSQAHINAFLLICNRLYGKVSPRRENPF